MNARNLLLFGAILSPMGVVVALVVNETAGAFVTVLGVTLALLGLHRFGRSGADRFVA